MAYTEITDNSSIFGGNVTADRFYEIDGTYVIPIYKVNWSDGIGDLEGIGLNATVKVTNLNYAFNLYWQNITNFPIDISFFNNDVGYITMFNLTVYQNLSQFINDVGYILSSDLTWNNITGKPTLISYWQNDVGYITMLNLTELQQQVQILNSSLQNESLIRNQTDDVILSILNIIYNDVQTLNNTKSGIGNCPSGYAVQNLTTGSPQCIQLILTETDPIFTAENLTIWNAIWDRMLITDQRYNDTALIYQIENALYTNINNLNLSLQDERQARIQNDSYILNQIPYVQGDGVYTYNTSSGQVVTIHFNETKLNDTINKTLSQIQHYFEENVTFAVNGSGNGYGITVQCCSVPSEILEIAVFPTSSGNKYRFSANTSITGQVVDANLVKHTGTWIVSHGGTVVTNEKITYFVINADTNENFRVRVRWEQ
jgi:hypothetical protein